MAVILHKHEVKDNDDLSKVLFFLLVKVTVDLKE